MQQHDAGPQTETSSQLLPPPARLHCSLLLPPLAVTLLISQMSAISIKLETDAFHSCLSGSLFRVLGAVCRAGAPADCTSVLSHPLDADRYQMA